MKNNLTVVEALATLSAQDGGDVPGFLDRFFARMRALAAAQGLLSREPGNAPEVEEIVASVMAPFEEGGRLSWSGDRLRVDGQQAVALAMCLHELATNSLKYGALSRASGVVRITWRRRGRGAAQIEWEEIGGPEVAEPARTGSGTRLLRRGLDVDLPAQLAYRPEGLRWTAPLRPRA